MSETIVPKVLACPFCGFDDVQLDEVDMGCFAVCCPECECIGPVSRMSAAADKVSTGDFDQPEFPEGGRDEVAVLASSFNRMRRSLEKAMQMIDS